VAKVSYLTRGRPAGSRGGAEDATEPLNGCGDTVAKGQEVSE
jgi:hypothetical protein